MGAALSLSAGVAGFLSGMEVSCGLWVAMKSLSIRRFDAAHGQDDLRISLCDAALALAAQGTSTHKVTAKTQRGRGEPRPDESKKFGKKANVQEIQGFERERNTGAGHFFGGRGRADLRRVRGRFARDVPFHGEDV